MNKINTGGTFIDFLSTWTGGADEGFLKIVIGDAQFLHSGGNRVFFF
jgi:hypothetical protein